MNACKKVVDGIAKEYVPFLPSEVGKNGLVFVFFLLKNINEMDPRAS